MQSKEPWDFTVWAHTQIIPKNVSGLIAFKEEVTSAKLHVWLEFLRPLVDLPNATVHALRMLRYLTIFNAVLNGYGGHCIPNAHTSTHPIMGWEYNRGCERTSSPDPVIEIGELVLQYAGFISLR